MDFFEHQAQAKRKTGKLVLLFALAVAFLIAGLYFVVRGVILWNDPDFSWHSVVMSQSDQSPTLWNLFVKWDPEVFWWVSLGTLFVVLMGSIYKILQLQNGGAAIATSLGGRLLSRSTRDPHERQLLNVVDEMAIASGVTAPPVYLMDHEPAINAFAAGFTIEDAVIGVTRGCIELLSREELQGVIAHEFSHILNGDMHLNIQITGLIHGILIIGLAGRMLLRGIYHRSRYRLGSRSSGKQALPLFLMGLSLMAIGYMGVFFGNMIKAAVSRQREFLADASAVQFTRQPSGITGALKKIGGLTEGSMILDPECMTVSHMFFGQALFGGLDSMLATHPPLIERIRRIEPRFQGRFSVVKRPKSAYLEQSAALKKAAPSPTEPVAQKPKAVVTRNLPDPIALIGNPTAAHLDYAHALVESLPDLIREAARDPYGARAMVYALLLSGEKTVREAQDAQLQAKADPQVYEETRRLEKSAKQIEATARLPLLDMAIPTLAQLSPRQYRIFRKNVQDLVNADQAVEPFEWMLQHVVIHHLDPKFRKVRKPIVQYYSLKRLNEPCSRVLSALAYASYHNDEHAHRAFQHGAAYLQIDGVRLQPRELCRPAALDLALETLVQCSPREKRKVMQAFSACILADSHVTVEEAELLRAVAASLGCPMPPLLAGQTIESASGPDLRTQTSATAYARA